jgi:hypothetical protein
MIITRRKHASRSDDPARKKVLELNQEFYAQLIFIFLLLFPLIMGFVLKPGDRDYDTVQRSLPVIIGLVALMYILAPSTHRGMFNAFHRLIQSPTSLTIVEWTGLLYLLMYLIALIMIVAVDWSSVFDLGIRVGTVVTVSILRGLRIRFAKPQSNHLG